MYKHMIPIRLLERNGEEMCLAFLFCVNFNTIWLRQVAAYGVLSALLWLDIRNSCLIKTFLNTS